MHDEEPRPLNGGWIAVIITIGVMAALIAIGGMVLSFRAVSAEMAGPFGPRWAWLVPVVVDLTVFVFSGVDLVLARLDMDHPLARWTVYGATGGTVYLNYSAGGTIPGRVAHVLMPSIWVVFIELMRHVVRRQVNLATASHREPVPAARWLLSPWPTLKLWRRMVLWRVNSYPRALDQERARLGRIAALRVRHGRLWRWRVSALERLELSLGDTPTAPATRPGDTATHPAATTRPTPADRDTQTTVTPDTRHAPTTPRHDTPRTGTPATPRRDTPVPLPVHDRDTDTTTLQNATPPEWQSMSKAASIRRADELLPGRTAGQIATLLAAVGVTATPVDVRKTRQRARDAAAATSQDAEPEPADDERSA